MDLFEREDGIRWAAGIIDGEGHIFANNYARRTGDHKGKVSWAIHLKASNTDPRMALRMRELFGVGSIHKHNPPLDRPQERPTFDWEVASRKAVAVLELIRPFLVLKGEQADIALAYAATLHRKGSPATWTGSGRNGTKVLKPEILAKRIELAAQLKELRWRRRELEEVN